jgi:hypothetical protein
MNKPSEKAKMTWDEKEARGLKLKLRAEAG